MVDGSAAANQRSVRSIGTTSVAQAAVYSDSVSRLPVETLAPKPFDVLLGRGRWYASHAGNRRLQIFINMHLEEYQATQSRPEKTKITNEILHMVKICGKQPGRFLKYEDTVRGWVEVNDEVARLKISQAMRYTIRSPQEGLIPSSMLGGDEVRLSLVDPSVNPANVSAPIYTEMGPPPPRRISDNVSAPENHEEVEGDVNGLIMSDEAILSSLGYAPPLRKKRRSKNG